MYNDSDRISASEINRFTYCPYQWYYERKFGRKHLTSGKPSVEKKKPSVKKISSSKHVAESNFERGRKFHDEYDLNLSPRRGILRPILYICAITIILFFLIWVAYL